MPEPEQQQMPDVSTEPQRKALDEMSRQLIEKLNAMVNEQNERARRFAATQHSLSPLPGVPTQQAPAPEPAPAEPEPILPATPAPPAPQPPPPAPPVQKYIPFMAPGNKQRKLPQEFSDKPLAGAILSSISAHRKAAGAEAKKKTEESGCGAVPTIVFIIILIIILRSCS